MSGDGLGEGMENLLKREEGKVFYQDLFISYFPGNEDTQ